MFFVDEEANSKLKKCDKYVYLYTAFNVLLSADLIAGMALDGVRPDIVKKLIVAGVILAVGAFASMIAYFKSLDKLMKQSDFQSESKNDSKSNLKISSELNKLLDSIVYNNER